MNGHGSFSSSISSSNNIGSFRRGQITVHILGPALLARAFESLLVQQPYLHVVSPDSPEILPETNEAAVAVLFGTDLRDAAALRERFRSTLVHFVLVTDGTDIASGRFRALNVRVFVGDDEPLAVVIEAIQNAARGQAYCSPQLFTAMVGILYGDASAPTMAGNQFAFGAPVTSRSSDNVFDGLSHREREVAGEAAKGLSNDQIAGYLHISVSTVKFHLFHAFKKLGVTRRSQLRYALMPLQAVA